MQFGVDGATSQGNLGCTDGLTAQKMRCKHASQCSMSFAHREQAMQKGVGRKLVTARQLQACSETDRPFPVE